MRLEVDIGNTRLKWRLTDKGGVVRLGEPILTSSIEAQLLDQAFEGVDPTAIHQVGVASVVPSCHDAFAAWCESYFSLSPQFVSVERACLGVTNAYEDISQMGVDRWLALLAAFKPGRGALVVSAGSAVTIDAVDHSGQHLGGYIVPGLHLMRTALAEYTDRVNVEGECFPQALSLGHSTTSAVMSGLPRMLCELIGSVYQQLLENNDGRVPPIIVSGGDGEYLSKQVEELKIAAICYQPSLVLDGLGLVLDTQGE